MDSNEDYRKAIALAEKSASTGLLQETAPQAGDWRSNLVLGKGKRPDSKQCNYSLIMMNDENLKGCFRFDKYRHQVTVLGKLPFGSYENPVDFDEIAFTKLLGYLGFEYGIDNDKMARRAVNEVAASNSYDSLIDTLDGLKWDGEPRIETMLSILLGAEDSDYTREAAGLLMRGAVCRAYAPNGVQFDIMPVLVGPQGCRKTSFCRSLALSPDYFEDNLGDLSKPDAARKMQGALIVEMAELASIKSTKQREAIKAFLTRIHDTYRLLYAEEKVTYPRRCICIGTTNDFAFMTDSFWDRRCLPVECGVYETEFDWTDEKAVKYFFEQIWAEAIVWYKHDPEGITKTLTPTPAMLEENRKWQNHFKIEDPWHALIAQYLSENEDREICAKELINVVADKSPSAHKADKESYRKIHEIMRNLFTDWERVDGKTKRLGDWGPQSVYYVHRTHCEPIKEKS